MSDSLKLLSEASFASLFVYSPRPVVGEGEAGSKSRRLVRSIKNEARQFSRRWSLPQHLRLHLGLERVERFLSESTTLVPIPGHVPLREEHSRWPARELCAELVAAGLGRTWMPLLERTHRVPKAAFARPEERPGALAHYQSFRSKSAIEAGSRITVVDDVITRGATMLAAISLLQQTHPGAEVLGFAFIRTMSDVPLQVVTEPVTGTITLHGEETRRRP